MTTTTNRRAEITFSSDLEIHIKRRFDAPREIVSADGQEASLTQPQ